MRERINIEMCVLCIVFCMFSYHAVSSSSSAPSEKKKRKLGLRKEEEGREREIPKQVTDDPNNFKIYVERS